MYVSKTFFLSLNWAFHGSNSILTDDDDDDDSASPVFPRPLSSFTFPDLNGGIISLVWKKKDLIIVDVFIICA